MASLSSGLTGPLHEWSQNQPSLICIMGWWNATWKAWPFYLLHVRKRTQWRYCKWSSWWWRSWLPPFTLPRPDCFLEVAFTLQPQTQPRERFSRTTAIALSAAHAGLHISTFRKKMLSIKFRMSYRRLLWGRGTGKPNEELSAAAKPVSRMVETSCEESVRTWILNLLSVLADIRKVYPWIYP